MHFLAHLSLKYIHALVASHVKMATTPMHGKISSKIFGVAPVAKPLRALFLYHSIISPLCLVCVRAPLWPREASQVLLAGVPGGFSRGSPVFAPPSDWPVSYKLK